MWGLCASGKLARPSLHRRGRGGGFQVPDFCHLAVSSKGLFREDPQVEKIREDRRHAEDEMATQLRLGCLRAQGRSAPTPHCKEQARKTADGKALHAPSARPAKSF